MVIAYHEKFPLRTGIPRQELKSRLKIDTKLFNAMLEKMSGAEELIQAGGSVKMPTHSITFTESQQAKIHALTRRFSENPYAPPTIKASYEEVGDEILNALIELGDFVKVSQEVIFQQSDYKKMEAMLRAYLDKNGKITLSETRDLFGTSRRYAQAFLEHLDAEGVTKREDDYRVLVSSS